MRITLTWKPDSQMWMHAGIPWDLKEKANSWVQPELDLIGGVCSLKLGSNVMCCQGWRHSEALVLSFGCILKSWGVLKKYHLFGLPQ